MKVNVAKIAGVDDAILSLYFSKRSWTPEKSRSVRQLVQQHTDHNGFLVGESAELDSELAKVFKYGTGFGHEVILSMIDITIEIQGLHRGGQDDWDAHAYRFHNRIVRSSTRLAQFEGGEMSDYYKDNILYPMDALDRASVPTPLSIYVDGVSYERTPFGYVKEGVQRQDVVRGLYPLAIPCDSITKVNYRELRHVYHMRGEHSHANPEVKQVAEGVREDLRKKFPLLGDMLGKVLAETSQGWKFVERADTKIVQR